MIINVHKAGEEKTIVVLVDSDLVGKKFEEGNIHLDLSKDFYKGEEKNEGGVKDLLRGAYIIHIVGKRSLEFCEKEGIKIENVITVDGVPHAEVVLGGVD